VEKKGEKKLKGISAKGGKHCMRGGRVNLKKDSLHIWGGEIKRQTKKKKSGVAYEKERVMRWGITDG